MVSDRAGHWNTWTDHGCELAPKCLECPLPQCKEDLKPEVIPKRKAKEDVLVTEWT